MHNIDWIRIAWTYHSPRILNRWKEQVTVLRVRRHMKSKDFEGPNNIRFVWRNRRLQEFLLSFGHYNFKLLPSCSSIVPLVIIKGISKQVTIGRITSFWSLVENGHLLDSPGTENPIPIQTLSRTAMPMNHCKVCWLDIEGLISNTKTQANKGLGHPVFTNKWINLYTICLQLSPTIKWSHNKYDLLEKFDALLINTDWEVLKLQIPHLFIPPN